MAFSKNKWHKIADKDTDLQWTPGDVAEVTIDGKKYCIARYNAAGNTVSRAADTTSHTADTQWFAFAYFCPHAGAPLTDGYIDRSCNVVCPVHNLKFNLRTGRDINGEGYKLRTYPVELRPDGLYISLDEGGFLKKWF